MGQFPTMSAGLRAELEKRRAAAARGADADDDEMDEDARVVDDEDEDGAEGKTKRARKSIFKDVILGDLREYPIEGQGDRGPRVADEGEDALGREYGSAVMDRIAGAFSRKEGGDPDAIPSAGAGETWEGNTRDPGYRPRQWARDESAYIGGETKTGVGGRTFVDEPGSYRFTQPDADDRGPVSLPGGMRVMSPQNSGIAPAAGFVRPEPVRKSERKVGVFKSVVFGEHGDQADSFLSE